MTRRDAADHKPSMDANKTVAVRLLGFVAVAVCIMNQVSLVPFRKVNRGITFAQDARTAPVYRVSDAPLYISVANTSDASIRHRCTVLQKQYGFWTDRQCELWINFVETNAKIDMKPYLAANLPPSQQWWKPPYNVTEIMIDPDLPPGTPPLSDQRRGRLIYHLHLHKMGGTFFCNLFRMAQPNLEWLEVHNHVLEDDETWINRTALPGDNHTRDQAYTSVATNQTNQTSRLTSYRLQRQQQLAARKHNETESKSVPRASQPQRRRLAMDDAALTRTAADLQQARQEQRQQTEARLRAVQKTWKGEAYQLPSFGSSAKIPKRLQPRPGAPKQQPKRPPLTRAQNRLSLANLDYNCNVPDTYWKQAVQKKANHPKRVEAYAAGFPGGIEQMQHIHNQTKWNQYAAYMGDTRQTMQEIYHKIVTRFRWVYVANEGSLELEPIFGKDGPYSYSILLRDPVSWTQSMYHYELKYFGRRKLKSLENYMRRFIWGGPHFATRRIAGLGYVHEKFPNATSENELFLRAKSMLEHFDFVGILEDLNTIRRDGTMGRVFPSLQFANATAGHSNSTAGKDKATTQAKEPLSETGLELIRDYTWMDKVLYEYGKLVSRGRMSAVQWENHDD